MSTLRTTILRHDPEPGHGPEAHYDWLMETEPSHPTDRDVATWRVGIRIDQMPPGTETALQRAQEHRGAWLQERRPTRLSGGRGLVSPCCHGCIQKGDFTNKALWNVSITWSDSSEGHYQIREPSSHEGTVTRLLAPV